MLLDLADQWRTRPLKLNGVEDGRQLTSRKLDIDDRTDNLNDLADLLLRCDFRCHRFSYLVAKSQSRKEGAGRAL